MEKGVSVKKISLAAYPEKIAAANFLHVNDAIVYELFDQVGYRLADNSCLKKWSKRCKEFKSSSENWGSISFTAMSSARLGKWEVKNDDGDDISAMIHGRAGGQRGRAGSAGGLSGKRVNAIGKLNCKEIIRGVQYLYSWVDRAQDPST